jgi:hypothetical protein
VFASQGGTPVITFARQVWMNRDGPSYIYQNGQVSLLEDLIANNTGWTYLAAAVRNAKGQIARDGDYKGSSHVLLMTPTS